MRSQDRGSSCSNRHKIISVFSPFVLHPVLLDNGRKRIFDFTGTGLGILGNCRMPYPQSNKCNCFLFLWKWEQDVTVSQLYVMEVHVCMYVYMYVSPHVTWEKMKVGQPVLVVPDWLKKKKRKQKKEKSSAMWEDYFCLATGEPR